MTIVYTIIYNVSIEWQFYPCCMLIVSDSFMCSIQVTFTDEKDGSVTTVNAPLGESLLEVAHKNDIDLEGVIRSMDVQKSLVSLLTVVNKGSYCCWLSLVFVGACEGSLACSTCHVIVEKEEYYNKLSEPDDDENDMLDLAFGLTDTSRLGCQVIAKPELDGMHVRIPSATRNFAVDGHIPKPH